MTIADQTAIAIRSKRENVGSIFKSPCEIEFTANTCAATSVYWGPNGSAVTADVVNIPEEVDRWNFQIESGALVSSGVGGLRTYDRLRHPQTFSAADIEVQKTRISLNLKEVVLRLKSHQFDIRTEDMAIEGWVVKGLM